ncbi:SURF1 family protein [Saccharothrix longispora]|uniref:SURF1 family cytochrome oxidase biogenesis protein n=1 Tax=Saccharothrix longispora TaxID=33920 RepID=UPI0028FD7A43|nr:SURF1 family cytochrome oxidase biogenesis protein [Saccharothrix longispora]MBY8847972.1 SURF1 family protein [Saccharothrix sp. MB29]MDU0291281.1 SURF1 family cytochrome oxidase biogenesis protein [Saccharothrix longispora]
MRFSFLLRPGWLALTLAVWVFAGACFALLAPWQFSRDDERQAQNDAVTSSVRTDPVPLAGLLDRSNAELEWRRVTLTGRYLPEGQAVARLRTVQGEAAFEVLTPFELDDGVVVLVDRGYVRPVSGVRVPDLKPVPDGVVTVTAWTRVGESDDRDAFDQDGHRQVYAINPDVVGRAAGLTIRPGYFQLTEGQPGVEEALPLPKLDAGPYFSYALQWIAFGVMALGGWLYFTVREVRPGGALAGGDGGAGSDRPRARRKSVAEMLAEDEDEAAPAR